MPKKTSLGRGLEAIFGEIENIENEDRVVNIALDLIKPNPFQPREDFDEKALSELAESIKEKGVIQPIIVRETDQEYQIVAGERRFLAARKAGLTSIPAIVRKISDLESAEIALIENIQRKDLNPIEEATAFKKLVDQFGYTQEELAKKVGKDRATIANSLRLLKLPIEIMDMLKKGEITQGHARALLALDSKDSQIKLANKIKERKLSVRDTENEVYDNLNIEFLREAEGKLKNVLNTPVKVKMKGNKYKVELVFGSLNELNTFLGRF